MDSQLSLSGKVAIVTGSSRGIGAGVAIDLARKGANVRTVYLFLQCSSTFTAFESTGRGQRWHIVDRIRHAHANTTERRSLLYILLPGAKQARKMLHPK